MGANRFELLTEFPLEYAASSVKKWKSSRTGLQAALVDRESPIVDGFFAVATEATDDSGAPHTLEHLVFMGSKKYPYKGLLDTLGNKALSSTNAWTAVDQTVYTLTTAGWEGFKQLLPVYLDHILNPTLTDEACYTEVYHIDGDGKEKGVVFSEMQGIQNQPWFISMLHNQRSLFHEKSGYSSETGGLLENLRKLSNETIRQFHTDSYRPNNLCVIVTGNVDEEEFLSILNKFDSELPSLDTSNPPPRPFLDSKYSIEPLTENKVKYVEFPEKDESYGEITISWIGPKHEQFEEDLAISLLLEYLCDSPIALLTKNLIEIDDPLATEIESNTDDYMYIVPYIKLNDVPTDKLDEALRKFWELLMNHANTESFDLDRMKEIIENSKLKLISNIEKSPDALTDYLVNDFLYSDLKATELKQNLQNLNDYNTIATWSIDQWVDLFRHYLIDSKSSVIISKPSKKLYKELKQNNKKLNNDILTKYGESGLKDLKTKLEKAMEKNNKPIPMDILNNFPKPDASKIKFINTTSVAVGLNKDIENDLKNPVVSKILEDVPKNKDFPLYINIENFKSQFISIEIIMSSFEIPAHLLQYFEVFATIFSLPLNYNNQTIPYEQVVKELTNDTIEHAFYSSFHYQFNEVISSKIEVKKENYSIAIEWFKKIFFHTKFEESRVKTAIDKIINSLSSNKRSSSAMLNSLISKKCFTERSLHLSKDFLNTEVFYKELLKKIEDGGFDEIEADLELFRKSLFKLNNFRVLISGDVASIENPVTSWLPFINDEFLFNSSDNKEITVVPRSFNVLTEFGSNLVKKALIITVPSSDSTFLNSTTTIVTDYNDKDSAVISLTCSYLQAVEGPFWRGIRGTGLAYGANIRKQPEDHRLTFDLYRGADAIKAFEVASKIVNDLADGTTKFELEMVDGAISSLVNSIATSESNYYVASDSKYADNILKKRGPNFNTKFIRELNNVSIEDLVRIMNKYFVPLFNSKQSAVFVSAHPTKVSELTEFFEKQGYDVEVEESTLQLDEEGDEGEEDDDETGSESDSDSDSGSGNDSDSGSEEEVSDVETK